MANTVTTSIVVQFTTGTTSGLLIVEVDDREVADGGLNGGKTSFLPGDPVALLMYKSSTVVLDARVASHGSLSAPGAAFTVPKEEDITFAGETEATVRYPIVGNLTSFEWLGQSMGNISVVGENTLRIPEPAVGTYVAGVARVKYNASAQRVDLQHSALAYPEYSIVAFFSGHTP